MPIVEVVKNVYVCLSRFTKEGFRTTGNGQIYLTVGDVHICLFIKSSTVEEVIFVFSDFHKFVILEPFRENSNPANITRSTVFPKFSKAPKLRLTLTISLEIYAKQTNFDKTTKSIPTQEVFLAQAASTSSNFAPLGDHIENRVDYNTSGSKRHMPVNYGDLDQNESYQHTNVSHSGQYHKDKKERDDFLLLDRKLGRCFSAIWLAIAGSVVQLSCVMAKCQTDTTGLYHWQCDFWLLRSRPPRS